MTALVPFLVVGIAEDDTVGAGKNVVAGASLNIIKSGGGAASIYADEAGTTPISLPTTLDSSGQKMIFIAAGAYDVVIGGVSRRQDITGVHSSPFVVETFAALATTAAPTSGMIVYLKQHTSGGLGGGHFQDTAGTITNDGGTIINNTMTVGRHWKRIGYEQLTTDMFGGKNDGTQNGPLISDILAVHDEIHIPAGIFDSYKIQMADNKRLYGAGEQVTRLRISKTTGENYGIKISNLAIGSTPAGSDPVDRTVLNKLTVICNNIDYGVYSVHARFMDWDEVLVEEANICNWFIAYCFTGTIGRLTAFASEGTGIEYGNDRFGWGGDLVSNNAITVKMFWAYGNGASLSAPPSTPTEGAGVVWGTTLACPSFLYAEGNNGHGIVTNGSPCYIPSLYVEANDTFSVGAAKIEVYADSDSGSATFGDVAVLGGALGSMYCAKNTVIENYGGTRITGPGKVRVNGYYRDCTITNPSTLGVAIAERFGIATDIIGSTKAFTLNKGNLISFSKFVRNGVYRVYPRITFDDAGTVSTGVQCTIINQSTAVAKYYEAWSFSGSVTAGQSHDFSDINLTDYDDTDDYQIFFEGSSPFAGRVTLSLIADLMV